jgi:hypothetical protein
VNGRYPTAVIHPVGGFGLADQHGFFYPAKCKKDRIFDAPQAQGLLSPHRPTDNRFFGMEDGPSTGGAAGKPYFPMRCNRPVWLRNPIWMAASSGAREPTWLMGCPSTSLAELCRLATVFARTPNL